MFGVDWNAFGGKICLKYILLWPWLQYCITYLLESLLSNCPKIEEEYLDLCHVLQYSLDTPLKKPHDSIIPEWLATWLIPVLYVC